MARGERCAWKNGRVDLYRHGFFVFSIFNWRLLLFVQPLGLCFALDDSSTDLVSEQISGGTAQENVAEGNGDTEAIAPEPEPKPEPEPEPAPKPEPEPEVPDSPQTGDNSNLPLWFGLMGLSGASLIGIALYSRKRRREEL